MRGTVYFILENLTSKQSQFYRKVQTTNQFYMAVEKCEELH